jgi:prepilin-type N-terminal cleavage/methylation domain-containing protein
MFYRRSFTLLELLFVVAVIAVLAAIGVPNFLEAQTKSKMTRTMSDMATISAAVRAYAAQYDAYPPNQPEFFATLRNLQPGDAPPPGPPAPPEEFFYGFSDDFSEAMIQVDTDVDDDASGDRTEPRQDPRVLLSRTGYDLAVLTTPVAWLSRELPLDLFDNESTWPRTRQRRPFIYINLHAARPEDRSTTASSGMGGYVLLSNGPDGQLTLYNPVYGPYIPYDPTNGTTSEGDLFMTGW